MDTEQNRNARRTVWKLVGVTLAMFAFGFVVMPPMYNVFCAITGLNGKTERVTAAKAAAMKVDESRLITVEFMTNVAAGMPWEFRSEVQRMQVHPGQLSLTYFDAKNMKDRPVVGQAVPSLAPNIVARYFQKTECFCFSRQPLAAKEEKRMPVRFVIDPALPKEISTVTLSYTFFNAPETASNDAVSVGQTGSSPN